MTRTLWLGGYHRAAHQLTVSFGVDELRFSTTYWYADVDLLALEEQYGLIFLEKCYFHIAAFEANKLCCLRPRRFDLGPFTRFHTRAFEELWRTVLRHVWAQWRYEHDETDDSGPELTSKASDAADLATPPLAMPPGPVASLAFCGGGKDSLLTLKLLAEVGMPFDAFTYSSSIYGPATPQHQLSDRLLAVTAARNRRRLWIYDDFMDSPVVELQPELGARSLLAAETPSSVFSALPLILGHGYRQLIVGHERSADFNNLIWEKTGEAVNHQWGKSLAAEELLGRYLSGELIADVAYFSPLKPIYDVLIFNLLTRYQDSIPLAHSCNVEKPWCRRCAKCAYVWLNYMAYLPTELVDEIFHDNLFDREDNLLHYRQMLGLTEHTPFECLGTVDESRLAFELCRLKGLTGRAMEIFVSEVPAVDIEALLARFLRVEEENSAMPTEILERLRPLFAAGAADARQRLLALTGEVARSSR